MSKTCVQLSEIIPDAMAGYRLDQALAELFPDYSRARLQQWIRAGQVQVDAALKKPRDKVYGGEQVEVRAELVAEGDWQAQAIPLDIVYADDWLLIINKPPGLVVHPGAGNTAGTLVNALLHQMPELANVPRAGVVHRLDKDTSGLLVVARQLSAHHALVEQLQARAFEREYQAVVSGVLTAGGMVEAPLGRHHTQRTRMAVVESGKPAITHYRVEHRFRAHSLLQVQLETGRTHQIRVHMAHIKHPVLGDPLYAGRSRLPPDCSPELRESLEQFRRQALHATRLGLEHPHTGEWLEWEVAPPADMQTLLAVLAQDQAQHKLR